MIIKHLITGKNSLKIKMIKLSIVIPCYNEVENLPALVKKCKSIVETNNSVEIILVNNGSTDHSKEVLENLLITSNNIKSHHVEVNKGYGFGILEGLKIASADILCWTHADLQTDILDCLKAYNLFNEHGNDYLLIKGRRKGRPFFDTMFTSFMSGYVFYKMRTFLSDINAQPKLFSKTFFKTIADNAPFDFSLDLYFLLHAKNKGSIVEFPVDFSQRTAGMAKGGSGDLKLKIKLSKRTLSFINNFSKITSNN